MSDTPAQRAQIRTPATVTAHTEWRHRTPHWTPIVRWPAILLLLGWLALFGPASADDPKPERPLPRLPPQEPAEAARTFRTRDGIRMDLLAHEPMITSPVAVAYDEDGRAYVLEM